MITLRADQIAALQAAIDARFEQELAGSLRESWPEETVVLTDAELLARIRGGIADARRYGFDDGVSIERFINFRMVAGDRFPDPRWDAAVHWIFSQRAIPARERLDYALDQLTR